MQTLWITAAASAAAAYVCSQIWAPGTLAAAAFTPVLVAIIKEGLAKSTRVVTQAVPVRGVVRSARPEGPQPYDPADPAEPAARAHDEDLAERVAQPGEITYHGGAKGSRGLRVAIVTGLLGFVIAAAIFTVPELVAGGSAAGGGRGTTIFGGKKHKRRAPVVNTTTTTETKTVTTPPQRTVTLPPPTTVTQTVPVPTTTQPPPAQTTATPPPPAAEPAVPEPPTAQPPG
ncbi:MAG: hypothetical protein QOD37_886, partial [Gaiellales bacterium]|nr:hypothetical protein [Gaiellales bacterium]